MEESKTAFIDESTAKPMISMKITNDLWGKALEQSIFSDKLQFLDYDGCATVSFSKITLPNSIVMLSIKPRHGALGIILDDLILPTNLHTLILWDCILSTTITLPPNLHTFVFYGSSDPKIIFSKNIKRLCMQCYSTFSSYFNLDNLPPELEELYIGYFIGNATNLPTTLKKITVLIPNSSNDSFMAKFIKIPYGCELVRSKHECWNIIHMIYSEHKYEFLKIENIYIT